MDSQVDTAPLRIYFSKDLHQLQNIGELVTKNFVLFSLPFSVLLSKHYIIPMLIRVYICMPAYEGECAFFSF